MKLLMINNLKFLPTDKYLLRGKAVFLRQFASLADGFEVIFKGFVITSDVIFKVSRVEFSE